jgi:hypothetical protein
MAKENTFWFSHDYEPTSDPKIQAMMADYGGLGYGIYWRIIEMLHSDSSNLLPFKKYIYSAIAKQLSANVSTCSTKMNKIKQPELSAEQIEIFIKDCVHDYELFSANDDFFWSERVLRNMADKKSISIKRSESGKKSAEARKKAAIAQQMPTSVQQDSTMTGQDMTIEDKSDAQKKILAQLESVTESSIDPAMEKFYLMIVLKMIEVFMKKNPGYFFQKEADYSACLRIAYNIAQMKGWTKDSVLNGNMDACADSWQKIVDFIAEDKWFSGRSLTDIAKEWQRLVQTMNAKKKQHATHQQSNAAKSTGNKREIGVGHVLDSLFGDIAADASGAASA